MQPNDPPLLVASTDQLGLVERLRTDVLWHRRRGNETIARDCQEAADEIERLRAVLQRIERWHGEFPATGKRWSETGAPMSYSAAYGSNGERDYMRQVARDALVA